MKTFRPTPWSHTESQWPGPRYSEGLSTSHARRMIGEASWSSPRDPDPHRYALAPYTHETRGCSTFTGIVADHIGGNGSDRESGAGNRLSSFEFGKY